MRRRIKVKREFTYQPLVGVRKKIVDQIVHHKKGGWDYWFKLIVI